MIGPVIGVLFDGFAYGMLLFLLSVGLSVTLGMMNFVNLAHCAFAMLGGYVTVTLMNRFGWPFFATLPMAFLAAALVSVAFERVLYRRLYRASDLDQVLLTIGLAFVSVAVAAYFYGTIQDSYATGHVSGSGSYVGGLVGQTNGGAPITTTTEQQIANVELRAGYQFRQTQQVRQILYFGAANHSWQRNIQPTYTSSGMPVRGLSETYRWWQAFLGIKMLSNKMPSFDWGLDARLTSAAPSVDRRC